MGRTVFGWLAFALAGIATFFLAWFATDRVLDDRPMPCASAEVYVWVDYPDEAHCVSNTDHSQHEGH